MHPAEQSSFYNTPQLLDQKASDTKFVYCDV
jgi:hypothetical protein